MHFWQKIVQHRFRNNLEVGASQRASLDKYTERVIDGLILAVVFGYPLLFVPILTNIFDLPKNILLVVGSGLVIALWLLRQAGRQKIIFYRNPFDLPAIFLVGILIVSSLLTTNYLASLMAETLVVGGAVLLFLAIAQATDSPKLFQRLVSALLASSGILAFLTINQVIWHFVLPLLSVSMPSPLSQLLRLEFNPAGSAFVALLFFISLFPLAAGQKKISWIIILALGISAAAFSVYKLPPVLMPLEAGWKIAAGTIGKSGQAAILGAGPGNFLDAFGLFRPAELNLTSIWNWRLAASANFYFHLLTIGGIASLLSLAYLVAKLFSIIKKRLESPTPNPEEKGIIGSLIVTVVLWAIFPGNNLTVFIFFTLLGLFVAKARLLENLNIAKPQTLTLPVNPWLGYAPGVLALLLVGLTTFHLGKFAVADYYFANSLAAAQSGAIGQAYNWQAKAKALVPYNDVYRLAFSQTSLTVADNLAGQANNLSDQQKQVIFELVQQSIREAQAAVALAPNRAANYENLASIYRALINFAQGADQWAIATWQQAANLEPTNPLLRLNLGGIYFAKNDFLTAAQIFTQAVNLKPDLVNARYSLAHALKRLNMKDQALEQFKFAANLACQQSPNSADCQQINKEIAEMETPAAGNKQSSVSSPSGNLKIASESAHPNIRRALPSSPVMIASPSGEILPP